MKILTPGHRYELSSFENPTHPGQVLQFIEKQAVPARKDDGGIEQPATLLTVNDGTTNEEVLAMLIDRLKFLGAKVPSGENAAAVMHCEEALTWLNKRTADRKARGVEGTRNA